METIEKSLQANNVEIPVDESALDTTVEPVAEDENEDGTPILDEEDLEENDISEEEAEDIEWEEPEEDEKDITD